MPDQITKERRKDENERGLSRGDPRVQPIASAGQACSQRRLRTPLCAGQENERAGPVNGEPCSAAAAAALLRLCSEEIFSSLVPVYHVVQKSASMLRLKIHGEFNKLQKEKLAISTEQGENGIFSAQAAESSDDFCIFLRFSRHSRQRVCARRVYSRIRRTSSTAQMT